MDSTTSAFAFSRLPRATAGDIDLTVDHGESDEELGNAEAFLGAMVDELDFGVCVCDAKAHLLAANRSARVELAEGRVLGMERGQIRPSMTTCRQSFDTALQDAARAGLRRMVALTGGADRLVITVSPARSAAAGSVILLFGRRTFCSPLGLELLAGVHGLTYGERRVLNYLLTGERPSAISRSLGVSVNTVRTQIRSIRAKFCVDSIDALLIRLAGIPPVGTALRAM